MIQKKIVELSEDNFQNNTNFKTGLPSRGLDVKIIRSKIKLSDVHKVCITGKLDYGVRTDFENEISFNNNIFSSNVVNKTTDILVTNELTFTKKYENARNLGIPIMTEKEFLNLINLGEVVINSVYSRTSSSISDGALSNLIKLGLVDSDFMDDNYPPSIEPSKKTKKSVKNVLDLSIPIKNTSLTKYFNSKDYDTINKILEADNFEDMNKARVTIINKMITTNNKDMINEITIDLKSDINGLSVDDYINKIVKSKKIFYPDNLEDFLSIEDIDIDFNF